MLFGVVSCRRREVVSVTAGQVNRYTNITLNYTTRPQTIHTALSSSN